MQINKAVCSKVAYKDKAAAKQDIIDIKIYQKFRSKKHSKSKKAGQKLRAYECLRCGKWHLSVNVNYRKSLKRVKKLKI